MNKKNIIITISVLVLIFVGFFVYNNTSLKTNDKDTNENKQKGSVYDASYTYKVNNPSYKLNYKDLTINFKDAVVPYINLNSEDAKKANNEIKKIYEDFAKEYEENSNKKDAYFILKYDKYQTQGMLSILNIFERYAFVNDSEIQYAGYSSYVFDLESKKLIDFETVYKKLGYNFDDIERKLSGFIKSVIEEKYQGNDEVEKTELFNSSMSSFNESIRRGDIVFYVKDEGIVIVPTVFYGAGQFEIVYPNITILK